MTIQTSRVVNDRKITGWWRAGAIYAMLAISATVNAQSLTGKVALEGSLSANTNTPSIGDVIMVYLNVTTIEPQVALTLRIKLPPGLSADTAIPTERAFEKIAAHQTVTLALPVRIGTAGAKSILGEATTPPGEGEKSGRVFVVAIDAKSPHPRDVDY